MELYFLDSAFECVGIAERITYLRHARRFFAPSELEMTLDCGVSDVPAEAKYVFDTESAECTVIDGMTVEAGVGVTVFGRGAESLLERRIVAAEDVYSGPVESTVRGAVSAAFSGSRSFPGIMLGDECGISDSVVIPVCWDGLSEFAYSTLLPFGASYRVRLPVGGTKLVFEVVRGTDRSLSQSAVAPVVFSDASDGLANGRFTRDLKKHKNTAIVVGSDGTAVTVSIGSPTGENRRELFVSAKDLFPASFGTSGAYQEALRFRGRRELYKKLAESEYRGDVVNGPDAVFGTDYFLGDTVELVIGGVSNAVRMTCATLTVKDGVRTLVPSFGTV